MSAIDDNFNRVRAESTDMEGHMDVIRQYASMCPTIAELGVYDCTSTWALLAGYPKQLTSYDIYRRPEVSHVEFAVSYCPQVHFKFVLDSSLNVDIGLVDLLFIDSYHTYEHLKLELARHSNSVTQYIILHDTTTFADIDENQQRPGLWLAIEEFLNRNTEWLVRERFTHCHGLTVLQRR